MSALPEISPIDQKRTVTVRLVAWIVGLNGLVIVATTLLDQIAVVHRHLHLNAAFFDIPILVGVTLLYLSSRLLRRKQRAWLVTLCVYVFYIGVGLSDIVNGSIHDDRTILHTLQTLIVPAIVIMLLWQTRRYFTVASDREGFIGAIKFSAVVLSVAFFYGVSGYVLMDTHDYHREISVPTAARLTVDQLDLGTSSIPTYSTRGRLFDSSLSFIGVAAIAYVFIAFFQPIRSRVLHQKSDRDTCETLLRDYHGKSEDYFKLWPADKQYFFDPERRSCIAYGVHAGVAICLGDPIGDRTTFDKLYADFKSMCFKNDWRIALVHVGSDNHELFAKQGLGIQKIGAEAVVDALSFTTETARNKYFRHINNKFTKLGYHTELLSPPHSRQTLRLLRAVSDDWLGRNGREERGFVMGYFDTDYMQACQILALRDPIGKIQAFLNIVPAVFDTEELTYDLLRNSSECPSNASDFLLMQLFEYAHECGYYRINMGLCPLYGMKDQSDKGGILSTLLHFMFTYGNRVYSFSGLYRFKSKYEPTWRDRFLAYEDGITGLTKTVNALMRSMKI